MSGRPKANHRVNPSAIGTVLMAFVLMAVLLGSIAAHAQKLYGSITGTVADASGAVVPRAQITALSVDNRHQPDRELRHQRYLSLVGAFAGHVQSDDHRDQLRHPGNLGRDSTRQ